MGQSGAKLASLWLGVAIAWTLSWPHVAHGASGEDVLEMRVGIVMTSFLCPESYSESRCTVERTEDDQRALLNELENEPSDYYRLEAAEGEMELPLSKGLAGALTFATNHAAFFIFYPQESFRSITFTRMTPGSEPEDRPGSIGSVRRWYQHYRAQSISPTSRVVWRVAVGDRSFTFRFVGPTTGTEDTSHGEN